MNIVDRAIETLREKWRYMQEHARIERGAAYYDGYRAGLADATSDVEHMLRGLSTFEAFGLPDPKECHSHVWVIPVMWNNPPIFSAKADELLPFRSTPRLELQRIESGRDVWSWLVRPQVWTP